MAASNDIFPENISYGSKGGPGFNTQVLTTDSGQEERVIRWANTRHSYDAAYTIRSWDDMAALRGFFLTHRGAETSFLFKDWGDYTTHVNGRGAVTATDQIIGVGDGTLTSFQLVKQYLVGSLTYTRKITKPKTDTVLVAVNGTPTTTGWSVNLDTGVVLFTTPPAADAVITAGFQFYVPVRFGEGIDKMLDITADDFDNASLPSIPLIEVLDEENHNDHFVYRGGTALAITADITLSIGSGYAFAISADPSLSVFLPDYTELPTGGPYFAIINNGANSFTLKDHTTATLLVIAPSTAVSVILIVDVAGNKTWWCY